MPDNQSSSLGGPRAFAYSSRLLHRHPTQLARYAVSQPLFAPIQVSSPTRTPAFAAFLRQTLTAQSRPSQSESAIDRIVAIPHILEAIVGFSSRSTQVTLLTACGELHRMAGKQLYRVIKLDISLANPVFGFIGILGGALIGTGSHPTTDGCCADSALDSMMMNVLTSFDETYTSRLRATAKIANDTSKNIAGDVPVGTRNWHTLKPYPTNFKRSLLANTEVLTLGTHHKCFCGLFTDHWATLFPKLKTLRVSPRKSDIPFVLQQTCDGSRPCPLLTGVRPRKIVFRNVDGDGFVGLDSPRWNIPDLEAVVCFLPVDNREYHNPFGLLQNLLKHLSEAKEIKIVFYDKHEGALGATEVMARSAVTRESVNPDLVMSLLNAVLMNQQQKVPLGIGHDPNFLREYRTTFQKSNQVSRKCTVYGVGTLTFTVEQSHQLSLYNEIFPGQVLDRKKIVHIIKQEAPSQSLFMKATYPHLPFDMEAWAQGGDSFVFRTLAEYKVDSASRFAEINAED
ncbi:uncharacterized protein LOC62_01G001526 [Vanrija pseudolonga]|uniref:Uncharacterized protein n=1 Tax=Vanrija pseudolonga TaxID=143232 RepID=A0AAF0Y4A3_9TREE|nr:hypothetical protein LOC62_01G001526 [Vanrija pseudolonga]